MKSKLETIGEGIVEAILTTERWIDNIKYIRMRRVYERVASSTWHEDYLLSH